MLQNFRRSWAVILLLLTQCNGCQERGVSDPLSIVPADASIVALTPSPAAMLEHLDAFLTSATRQVGAAYLDRTREGMIKQFGFDPLKAANLSAAGIDLARPFVVYVAKGQTEPLFILGIQDRNKFDAGLAQFLAKSDGADKLSTKTVHGVKWHTAGRPFGNEIAPTLHWIYLGKLAVLARADGNVVLEQLLEQQKAPYSTIASDASFKQLQSKVATMDVTLFTRPVASDGSITLSISGIRATATGVNVDIFTPMQGDALSKAMGTLPSLELSATLNNDAALLALSHSVTSTTLAALRQNPRFSTGLDRIFVEFERATGISDAEHTVVPLLAGPLALGAFVADLKDLPQDLKHARAASALFNSIHVVVIAELRDAKGMLTILDEAQKKWAKNNVKLRKRSATFAKLKAVIYEPDKEDPRIGWAVMGNQYVYTAGVGRLSQTLTALANHQQSDLPKTLQSSVAGSLAAQPGSSVLVLRGNVLAEAITKLAPPSGAQLGVGAMIGAASNLLKTAGDIAVGMHADNEGFYLQIREQIQ